MQVVHAVADTPHGGEAILVPRGCSSGGRACSFACADSYRCAGAGQIIADSGTFAAINSMLDDVVRRVPKHPDYAVLEALKPRWAPASGAVPFLIC